MEQTFGEHQPFLHFEHAHVVEPEFVQKILFKAPRRQIDDERLT